MAKHLSDFEIIQGLDEAARRYAERFGGPIKVETGPGRYSIYGIDGSTLTTVTAPDLVPGTKGRGPIGREARAEKRPPLLRSEGPPPDDAS